MLSIDCPTCRKRYSVADSAQGKRVQCQQCGSVFTVELPYAGAKPESLDPLAVDLSKLPAVPRPARLPSAPNPLGRLPPSPYSSPMWSASHGGVSNPSGGPTDTQMRLLSGVMLALGIVMAVGSLALQAAQGVVYLGLIVLMPLMLVLGIAGLISPNVVRAAGKYGGHLPWHYKAIGWGVIGLSFALMVLLMVGLFLAGFEPDRPGGRNRGPGLTRSQTATVIERIEKSHQVSQDRDVVRTVTFPVFSINKPQPESEAERALKDVPGYEVGSFRLADDKKSVTFQYRGDKDIAIQYALLLPGPTGIFIEFSPKFEE